MSCDGSAKQELTLISRVIEEEVTGELSKLYSQGLHLVNCESAGNEFICVASR